MPVPLPEDGLGRKKNSMAPKLSHPRPTACYSMPSDGVPHRHREPRKLRTRGAAHGLIGGWDDIILIHELEFVKAFRSFS